MVKAPDFWNLDDFPGLSILDLTMLRTVPVQGEMGAPVVVVAEVAAQDPPRMVPAIHPVPIPQQIAGCLSPGEGFGHLLGGPLRRRVLGYRKVQHPPPMVMQHHQHEQHPEPDGRHHEEVDGDQVAGVVSQERAPGGGGWLTASGHVLADRCFRHHDAQLLQLPDDAWCSHPELARDILRMSCLISGAVARRPGLRCRLSLVQCSRERLRCQAMTVAGWTNTGASGQPDHTRESQAQKRRSTGLVRGLVPARWQTVSWCRKASTSSCIESRERKGSVSRARKVQIEVIRVESTIQTVEGHTG